MTKVRLETLTEGCRTFTDLVNDHGDESPSVEYLLYPLSQSQNQRVVAISVGDTSETCRMSLGEILLSASRQTGPEMAIYATLTFSADGNYNVTFTDTLTPHLRKSMGISGDGTDLIWSDKTGILEISFIKSRDDNEPKSCWTDISFRRPNQPTNNVVVSLNPPQEIEFASNKTLAHLKDFWERTYDLPV